MKLSFIVTILISILMSCSSNKEQIQEAKKADFQLTECGGTYKGKPLPFGKSISEWEKLFGKPTRKVYATYFIWDKQGFVIYNSHTTYDEPYTDDFNVRKYDQLLIFFSNLDSPAGKRGKLKFAYDRKSLSSILDMYEKGEGATPLTKELKEEFIRDMSIGGDKGPDKYIYPYTSYKQSVSLDGALVQPMMSLKELNNNREALNLNRFSFRDNNLNMINEQGTTKGDTGEYWDNQRNIKCENQNSYLLKSVWYSDYELEFIKIGYREQGDTSPYF